MANRRIIVRPKVSKQKFFNLFCKKIKLTNQFGAKKYNSKFSFSALITSFFLLKRRQIKKNFFFIKKKNINYKSLIKYLGSNKKFSFLKNLNIKIKNHNHITRGRLARRMQKIWTILQKRKSFQDSSAGTFLRTNGCINNSVKNTVSGSDVKILNPYKHLSESCRFASSFGTFNSADLSVNVGLRSKRFGRDFLSSFSYHNGKAVGLRFGLYAGFNYLVNHRIKRRFRNFEGKFDSIFSEEISDYNTKLKVVIRGLNQLNTCSAEIKNFQRDELWYYKNYVKQSKIYLRNTIQRHSNQEAKTYLKMNSKNLLANKPFTTFDLRAPAPSSFNENLINERLFGFDFLNK